VKTVTSDKSKLFLEAFAQNNAAEPAWGRNRGQRQAALAVLAEQGTEIRGREEWLFGDAGAMASGDALPLFGKHAGNDLAAKISTENPHLLVFVNGVFDAGRSRIADLPAGATVVALSAVDDANQVGEIARDQESSFTALNSAFWRDGVLVKIAAGSVLEHPIELHYLNDLNGQVGLIPVRNVVQVGDKGAVTFIERSSAVAEGISEQPLTEITCGVGAKVHHIKVMSGLEVGEHYGSTHVVQAADSQYRSWEILTGGRVVRRELHVTLAGTGADCDLNALYMGSGQQRYDLRTRVRHDAAGCETRELYKGIMDDASRGIFDGLIYVAKDSQQTNAHQTNRNLLLSDDAVVNSIPRLEIYADDVKCSHGSTTGQLSDDQLFYLQTRGFSPEEARTYLAWAFASEVVESIPVESLRKELSAELTRSLAVFDSAELEGNS
jgi:Fe-S cluster assembly protein SufD